MSKQNTITRTRIDLFTQFHNEQTKANMIIRIRITRHEKGYQIELKTKRINENKKNKNENKINMKNEEREQDMNMKMMKKLKINNRKLNNEC